MPGNVRNVYRLIDFNHIDYETLGNKVGCCNQLVPDLLTHYIPASAEYLFNRKQVAQ